MYTYKVQLYFRNAIKMSKRQASFHKQNYKFGYSTLPNKECCSAGK